MKDLTLLLLVKGREKFSFRWLDYLSKNQSECKIYVADGSEKKQTLEKYLLYIIKCLFLFLRQDAFM